MNRQSLGGILEALYSLARTGWMLRGVPPQLAETVAHHLFASAVIASELGWRLRDLGIDVNVDRAAALALAHDLGESVIGDISRRAGLGRAKREAEARAFESLPLSRGVKEYFREFEEASSIEAAVARVSELLATFWRACAYSRQGYGVEEIGRSTLEEALRLAGEWGFRGAAEQLARDLGGGECQWL